MAFSTLNLKHPEYEVIKKAPVGFAWTVFFFGFFPPLLRSDWKHAILILVLGLFTFQISTLIFMFIYNKMYVKSLLDEGYSSVDSESILGPIEAKLEMKIPRKLS
tara:strand:+ start:621 stop:935 length:315 start_codon:yes stop_codon:yes gene_type:complete